MNTDLNLPASKIQKAVQFPLPRLIIGFLLVFLPVAMGQMVIISLSVSRLWRSILVMVITLPVALIAYRIFVRFIEHRKMTELDASGSIHEIAQGFLIGALFSSGITGILALAGSYRVLGMNSPEVLLPALFFAVSSAVFEEILFRGVFFKLIEQRLGSWIALVLSAAIFGGLHLLNKNATIVGVTAIMFQAGITMAAAFMLTRRLWLPIGIHFGWNFTQAGIFASAVSGNEAAQGLLRSTLTGPAWLTGGVFGVEASIVTGALGIAAGILFILRANKIGHIIRG
jgi:membrane protease YdiL (CAAX protease family)